MWVAAKARHLRRALHEVCRCVCVFLTFWLVFVFVGMYCVYM